jgi:hypothetical protein
MTPNIARRIRRIIRQSPDENRVRYPERARAATMSYFFVISPWTGGGHHRSTGHMLITPLGRRYEADPPVYVNQSGRKEAIWMSPFNMRDLCRAGGPSHQDGEGLAHHSENRRDRGRKIQECCEGFYTIGPGKSADQYVSDVWTNRTGGGIITSIDI